MVKTWERCSFPLERYLGLGPREGGHSSSVLGEKQRGNVVEEKGGVGGRGPMVFMGISEQNPACVIICLCYRTVCTLWGLGHM